MSDASPEQGIEDVLELRPESASAPPPLPVTDQPVKSTCGVWALLCPFVAMGVAVPMSFMIPAGSLGGNSDDRGIALLALTMLPASLAGIVLALRAIARRERWFGAAVFALLLNIVTAGTTGFLVVLQFAEN